MISLCLHYKNRLPEIQASRLHQWSATCASYPHQQKGGAGSCTSHWRHLCHRWRADISWLPLWVCSWLDWASVGKVPKYIFNNLIRKRKKLFLSFKTHIESTFLRPFFSFFPATLLSACYGLLGFLRMRVPSCALWSTPSTGTRLSFTCKQMSQWSEDLTGDSPFSGTLSLKWNARGASLASTPSGNSFQGLLSWEITLSAWHMSVKRSPKEKASWLFFLKEDFIYSRLTCNTEWPE